MAHSRNELPGYRNKIAALLNRETFSDVEIHVNDGTNNTRFPAHKLILSLSSETFAKTFYENSTPSDVIKIFDFKHRIVFMMLEFLYTDLTDVHSIKEAEALYRLAKKYKVRDLEIFCLTYIIKESITMDNIFDKYEFALSESIPEILKACRDITSTKTMDVIQSPQFTQACMSVVEDILKLDTMSIMSELDLIEAVIKWAKQECFRRGGLTENLRICIYPLFKLLRFLTLSATEFCDFIEKHDNLINSTESTKLMVAILKPDDSLPLPSGFCSNSNRRKYSPSMQKESETLIPKTVDSIVRVDKKKPTWSFDLDLQDHLHDNFGLGKTTKDSCSTSSKLDEFNHVLPHGKQDSSLNSKKHIGNNPFSQTRKNSKDYTSKSYEMDEFDPVFSQGKQNSSLNSRKLMENDVMYSKASFNTHANQRSKNNFKPPPAYNRSDSVPIYIKKPSPPVGKKSPPVLRVNPSPQLSLYQLSFNFPLLDFDKSINSAFTTDIKCTARINVNKGGIEIYGIELKIKQKTDEEAMTVYLAINGSNISPRSITCEEKLKKNFMSLTFGEPIKLYQGYHLNIEVVVEDITLNRCPGCREDRFELNKGLDISAEILMKSNQTDNDKDFFYLFNRLIYKPLA